MAKILFDRSDFVEYNEDYESDLSDDPDESSPFDRMLKVLGFGFDERDSVSQITIIVESFSIEKWQ